MSTSIAPEPPLEVIHIGPDPAEPGAGGMARVISTLIENAPANVDTSVIVSMNETRRWFSIDKAAAAALRLLRARRRKPLIHAHVGPGGSLAREGGLAMLSSAIGLKTVVTVHASRLATDLLSAPKRRLVRLILRRADRVIVLGQDTLELLTPLTAGRKLTVVANGVTIPPLEPLPPGRDRVVFMAGELGPRKGIDVLFDAWESVVAACPNVKLILAGPRHSDFNRPPPKNCEHLGPLPPDQIPALIAAAHICVLPSRAEALPMFILESMAAGRPVVGTPVGNVAELLDASLLVPPGDAEQLGAKLAELVQADTAKLASIGQRLREKVVANFGAEAMAKKTAGIYSEVLNS